MQSFSDVAIPASIQNALKNLKFVTPTEVQAKTIPLALEGSDIIACASTGSGKTGAFAIPAITMLINNPDKNALVLAPTRELAQQISEFMRQITDYCEGITMVSIVGGFDMQRQLNALRRKPRIIIATPGRLTDHLRRRSVSLANTGILILDEGDRMLDMGFAPQLDAILQFLPQKRQTMLFTATMPPKVKELSRQYLHKPKDVTVGKGSQPVETVAQYAMTVPQEKKNDVLLEELSKRSGSVIVFARTQRRVDALAYFLEDYGLPVTVIHGGLTQGKRNRAIQGFKRGEYRILVATDIAARGIDVPAVEHVINFDLPLMDEDYVHRVGRTARNGAKGEALSFVSHHEYGLWANISRKYNVVSDAVQDPRKNKKGKKHRDRAERPMATRPSHKDNSFFVTDELPPVEPSMEYIRSEIAPEDMIEISAARTTNTSVREAAEQIRTEKFKKVAQRDSDAFDPQDREIEKALAEENLALDMKDGIKIETEAPEGFIPSERYAKRKPYGDRKERFAGRSKFHRRDNDMGDDFATRGSKPFEEKFFNGEADQEAEHFNTSLDNKRPARRFEPRGDKPRFNKGNNERRFAGGGRDGFKRFGDNRSEGGGYQKRESFQRRNSFGGADRPFRKPFGDRNENRGGFGGSDRPFKKSFGDNRAEGGGYQKRDGFQRRDSFSGSERPPFRKSFGDRGENRGGFGGERRESFGARPPFKKNFSSDRGERRDGYGGNDRPAFKRTFGEGGTGSPQKKNNWFSRDKDRRSTNDKRNSSGFIPRS